jgi:hypothetical protein
MQLLLRKIDTMVTDQKGSAEEAKQRSDDLLFVGEKNENLRTELSTVINDKVLQRKDFLIYARDGQKI